MGGAGRVADAVSMPPPLHVVAAGGGFAAAELLLALRALAEDRVTLELVSPSRTLALRAAATGEPFGASVVEQYDLEALAAEVGAAFRVDRLRAVAAAASTASLASGTTVGFDALVLATGARPQAAVAGASTYRDQRDAAMITRLLLDLRAGAVGSVVFAAPAGVTWTLPLYELALLTAREIDDRGLSASVSVITPEHAALEVFGPEASAVVAGQLRARGVRVEYGARARAVSRAGVELAYGGMVPADRVVAVPRFLGRHVAGVPADWSGFVPTDAHGRVEGLEAVFAAGDMTRFPVKQGGLATQHADVIAAELARRAGATVADAPVRHVLRSQLFGADGPLYLHAELDAAGRTITARGEPSVSTEPPWWPAAKVFGRYLTPWMAQHARGPMSQPA